MRRQPIELDRQFSIQRRCQFLGPACELFGCMSRPIIQYQCHRLHLTPFGLNNDGGLYKGAEVEKALAWVALTIDLPIRHTQSCHQMQSTMPMIARGLI